MARLAFTEMREVMDVVTETDPATGTRRQTIKVKDFRDIDADAHQAIVEVVRTPSGEIRIKLADKQVAIMNLARLKGWVQDKPDANTQAVQLIIQR